MQMLSVINDQIRAREEQIEIDRKAIQEKMDILV
jgi:hypothetical protein